MTKESIRAFIVDDEDLPAMQLRLLLQEYPKIKVVEVSHDPIEAQTQIEKLKPDLLFVDIKMPRKNGFEMLDGLSYRPPMVVFVTTHDSYAISAFDVNALDYLLKPVDKERLALTVRRIEDTFKGIVRQNLNSGEEGEGLPINVRRFFIKEGNECWLIEWDDLRYAESDGTYTRLFFKDKKPLVKRTLNYLEERLPENQFFRASRKHLINLDWIDKIMPLTERSFMLRMKDGKKIQMSRRASQELRSAMSI